jgi:two-component system, chemotaxis family, sensor kinase CheA
MNDRFRMFVEECQELLAELETALLELETTPGSVDGVHRVFRALHTIKGSAAMLGLEDVRELTNDLESAFDLVRAERLECAEILISLSFAYKDLLTEYLRNPESGLPLSRTTEILGKLENLVNSIPNTSLDTGPEAQSPSCTPLSAEAGQAPAQKMNFFYVRYAPVAKRFDAFDPMDILSQLAGLGECEINIQRDTILPLEEIDPETCSLSWDIVLRTREEEDSVRDVFLFLEAPEEIAEFRAIDATGANALTCAMTDNAAQVCHGPLDHAATSGEIQAGTLQEPTENAAAAFPAPKPRAGAYSGPQKDQPDPKTGSARDDIASIRVSAPKLDDMIDLVGQLVIVQARLKQIETELHHPHLTSVSEEIERLSNDLRERTLSLRMLPIGSTFNKFRRLVRDLSVELNKEIELKTFGAETELDKTVIEKMNDPLVHILRNSIDHGVETADVRQAQGKPSRGVITLSARQSAGKVHIIIEDDGGGINPDKIFAKAVECGLARIDNRPSNKEILQFIFHPGFSTAEKVTSVSGRGVGMDVVRRSLESLKGNVEVDSVVGRGTTITIGLPLTLAIIEGLLVLVGREYYVVPLSEVIECLETSRKPQDAHRLTLTIDVRGRLLPCLVMRNWFHLDTPAPEIEQVVVVQAGTRKIGLIVDSIVGQLQTVIKGLGRVFTGLKGVSGATIMGNGSLALILDTPSLIQELESHQEVAAQGESSR